MLPQTVPEGQQYLTGEGIHVDEIKQASPASLGVAGTPTMLLVDGRGVVTRMWVGKLDTEKENEVISAVRNQHS